MTLEPVSFKVSGRMHTRSGLLFGEVLGVAANCTPWAWAALALHDNSAPKAWAASALYDSDTSWAWVACVRMTASITTPTNNDKLQTTIATTPITTTVLHDLFTLRRLGLSPRYRRDASGPFKTVVLWTWDAYCTTRGEPEPRQMAVSLAPANFPYQPLPRGAFLQQPQ